MLNGLTEIIKSLTRWRIWGVIALDDVAGRYRRTVLGPLWLFLAQFAFIIGIYFLHRTLLGGERENYLLYLSASLPLWALLSGFLIDPPTALLRSKGFIESYPLPLAIYVIRSVASNFLIFAHLIVAFAVMSLVARDPLDPTVILWPLALAIYAAFGLGAALLLAPLSARYRDLGPALTAFTSLMFVLTPVFWAPNETQRSSPLLLLNPFYHLLEVGRAPLLGEWGGAIHWGASVALAVGALALGMLVFARMRRDVVYWL
jgi:ABC-type polysaccharide/polyol phosphate export permease